MASGCCLFQGWVKLVMLCDVRREAVVLWPLDIVFFKVGSNSQKCAVTKSNNQKESFRFKTSAYVLRSTYGPLLRHPSPNYRRCVVSGLRMDCTSHCAV